MWAPIWPGASPADARVAALTNGVHAPTWMSTDMADLFDRHVGHNWVEHHDEPAFWDKVMEIPDEEPWAVRNALRHHLFAFIRARPPKLLTDDRPAARRGRAARRVLGDP